ncbi:MAG: type VI secretion system Vgr family protein, partial [Thermoanaerobaculia bacterium]
VAALLACLLCVSIASAQTAAPPASTVTASGPFGTVSLTGFDGDEALSTLFHFDLSFIADAAHPIAFGATLGHEVTVTLPTQGSPRFFSGICSRISESTDGRRFTYQMQLVPKLTLLAHTAQSRIFQDKSVPEILDKVLSDRGITFTNSLKRNYPKRNYVVQYRETDFNFASRLMEEEGIFYFFNHAASGHTLVITDSSADLSTLAGTAPFDSSVNSKRTANGITSWEKTQELTAGKYTLRDHNFQLPEDNLESSDVIQQSVDAGQVNHQLALPANQGLEIYDYPGGYAKEFDGASDLQKIFTEGTHIAAVRMEEVASNALVIEGAGGLPHFVTGAKFTLSGHPNANGNYVLTSIHHSVTTTGRKSDYHNNFTCIPAGLPFRPKRSAMRPVIEGTQTAVVVGPAGEEIFIDQFGRVKVQFFWDRQGKKDANSSAWIRVGALHQGQENGFTVAPRIGEEVIVAFQEGDPDQPIIVGSAYGPEHPVPPIGSGAPPLRRE